MIKLPELEVINQSLNSPWDFGNGVLYDLCRNNFYHKEPEEILSKVWLIGRAYSAAIERRRNKDEINDNFYIDKVVPEFIKSKLDTYLDKLKKFDSITIDNLPTILEAHYYLTQLTARLTDLEKRSFSSKYLHFHLPNQFFIYDSRVVGALRNFVSRVPKSMNSILIKEGIDTEYAKFAGKSFVLWENISEQYHVNLTLRQFDNVLIHYANLV